MRLLVQSQAYLGGQSEHAVIPKLDRDGPVGSSFTRGRIFDPAKLLVSKAEGTSHTMGDKVGGATEAAR